MEGSIPMPVVKCGACEALYVPPVYVCRRCHSTRIEDAALDGRGTVYTYTTIRVAPESLKGQVPYTIVVVEVSPDLIVSGRLEGAHGAGVRIGQPVRFKRVDEQGYWFESVS